MTRQALRRLIERCATEAASKYGAKVADVLGTSRTRECVFARRDAMRSTLSACGCSEYQLAKAWGVDRQTVHRAVAVEEPHRPFSINEGAAADTALRAKLVWLYGAERAAAILAGNDPATQADIRRWNSLGRRDAT